MTAKEKVLDVWPDAYCEEPRYGRGYSIWRGKESEDWFYGLGGGDSEEAAWQNAAESLPAQVEQEIGDSVPERIWDEFGLGKVESLPAQPEPCTDLVERIAVYVESESECLMPIVVEETKHDYGVRLLKVMADEIRERFQNYSDSSSILEPPEQLVEDGDLTAWLQADGAYLNSGAAKLLIRELQQWRKWNAAKGVK